jgi:hypothetical protein
MNSHILVDSLKKAEARIAELESYKKWSNEASAHAMRLSARRIKELEEIIEQQHREIEACQTQSYQKKESTT